MSETADQMLHAGYALRVVGEERRLLRLEAPDGRVCLTISLHESGPAVELAASSLRVATEGDLELDCGRLKVQARDGIAMASGGDLALQAAGDLRTEADGQRHEARLGNVDVVANDDVALQGERIRLNSPDVVDPRRMAPGHRLEGPRTRRDS